MGRNIPDHSDGLQRNGGLDASLAPLLYSLKIHNCVAKFRMNTIYKFADDTTIVERISNNDKSKYRREIEDLVMWCNDNNLFLNISKTKELIIPFGKNGGEHAPSDINGTEVERAETVKFLRVTITDNLSWTSHIDVMVKKAQQCLFFLRRLRKFSIFISTLVNFYRLTIEGVLSGCITAWYGNCSGQVRKKIQKVVCTAQTITEVNLPSMDSIYTAHCHGKAANIIKDSLHPSNDLLQPLPSGRRYRSLNRHTSRFRNSFFLAVIRLIIMNGGQQLNKEWEKEAPINDEEYI
eukprot:g34280.t1